MDKETAAQIVADSELIDISPEDIEKIVAHPVLESVFLVEIDGDGYVIDGEDVSFYPTYCDEDDQPFLQVTIDPDGTWTHPVSGFVFRCMHVYDDVMNRYEPTQFSVGEEVYPIEFLENNPGGWMVTNKDRSIMEYFQVV